MSGIAGAIDTEGRLDRDSIAGRVATLLDALSPRGPQAHTWIGTGCALGVRLRASSPEFPYERQPLVDEESGLVLLWDGRLDNRDELLEQLAVHDPHLPDSRLVLLAYQRWGEACALRIMGDFVFAVWNPGTRSLYAARDPLGMRSFFYSTAAGQMYFATEVQALLRLPEVALDFDEITLGDFLLPWTHFPEIQRTFFSAVRRLPLAHWLRWSPGMIKLERYWAPDPTRKICYRNHAEYREEFVTLLDQAVRRQVRSTRPLGIWLSGGLDSSALAWLASRHVAGERIFGYCMVVPNATDESGLAELAARRAGIGFRRMDAGAPSFLEGLEERVEWLAMPMVNRGWMGEHTYFSISSADGVHRILSGDGGDELFNFAWAYIADLIRTFSFRKLSLELRPIAEYYHNTPLGYLRHALHYLVPPVLLSLYRRVRWRNMPAWIDPAFAARTHLPERMRRPVPHLPFEAYCTREDFFHNTSGRSTLANESLELVAARYGQEFAYPFQDRRVMEFMFAVPWQEKTVNGRIKSFLWEDPNLLPEALRTLTKKADYGKVVDVGMRQRDQNRLREVFASPPHSLEAFVNLDAARAICDRFLAGGAVEARSGVWELACLMIWASCFSRKREQRLRPADGILSASQATSRK